jgi:hypothetical protein
VDDSGAPAGRRGRVITDHRDSGSCEQDRTILVIVEKFEQTAANLR